MNGGFPPPPGGPHGPMGGPGRGPWGPMSHYYFRPTHPAPGGLDVSTSSSISDILTDVDMTIRSAFSQGKLRKGGLGGIGIGIRKLTSGALRENSFVSKLKLCDKQLAENRITEEQCKRRKMHAAKKYYGYLLKIGFYELYEYHGAMHAFADQLNVEYVDDVHGNNGPQNGGPHR